MTSRHVTLLSEMAQGKSGRVVVDLDPEFKEELHHTLKQQGTTLKQWFIGHAEAYCRNKRPQKALGEENTSSSAQNQNKLLT